MQAIILAFYIMCVLYFPILAVYLPVLDFGAGIPAISTDRILLGLLIITFMLFVAIRRIKIAIGSFWPCWILLYSLFAGLSILYSQRSPDTAYIQGWFFRYLLPVVVVFIAFAIFSGKKYAHTFLKHTIFASSILATIMVINLIVGQGHVNSLKEFRDLAGNNLGNPNLVAIYLVFSVPAILYSWEEKLLSPPKIIPLSLLIVAGIILTISRKGYVGCSLSILLYFLLRKKFKMLFMGVLTLALSFYFLLSFPYVKDHFIGKVVESQLEGRSGQFYSAIRMWADKPLIGWGYKGWLDNNQKYLGFKSDMEIHNIYLNTLVQTGLIGFIPFIMIFLHPLISGIRRLRACYKFALGKLNIVIVSIIAIIVYMFEAFFAGGLFGDRVTTYILYTYMVILFSASSYIERAEEDA